MLDVHEIILESEFLSGVELRQLLEQDYRLASGDVRFSVRKRGPRSISGFGCTCSHHRQPWYHARWITRDSERALAVSFLFKLYSSVVHQILRKRLYTGDFDWDGSTYTGSDEPLVTRECWQRVQELLGVAASRLEI